MKAIYFLVLFLILSGCAATYRPIKTNELKFTQSQKSEDFLEINYEYNTYYSTYNIRYHKKDKKYDFNTVAVEIINKTTIPIIINKENFKIYSDSTKVDLLSNMEYINKVKQKPGLYLFHTLWGPWSFQSITDPAGNTTKKIKFLPIGLVIGIANAIVANKSNKRLEDDIERLNIYEKTIQPQDTLIGIINIKGNYIRELDFRYLE
jgi:hypothetical protein